MIKHIKWRSHGIAELIMWEMNINEVLILKCSLNCNTFCVQFYAEELHHTFFLSIINIMSSLEMEVFVYEQEVKTSIAKFQL